MEDENADFEVMASEISDFEWDQQLRDDIVIQQTQLLQNHDPEEVDTTRNPQVGVDMTRRVLCVPPTSRCHHQELSVGQTHNLQFYMQLRESVPREKLRELWPTFTKAAAEQTALDFLEQYMKSVPGPALAVTSGERASFVCTSPVDVIVQAIATKGVLAGMQVLPRKSTALKEFMDTPRCAELYEHVAASSVVVRPGFRVFVHDVVEFQVENSGFPQLGIVKNILVASAAKRIELSLWLAIPLDHEFVTHYVGDHVLRYCNSEKRHNFVIPNLPRDSRGFSTLQHFDIPLHEVSKIIPNHEINFAVCIYENPNHDEAAWCPVSDAVRRKFLHQHDAVKTAREQNCDLVVLPLGVFSDETSGCRTKQGNFHESCSISFLSQSFADRQLSCNHHLVSTASMVLPIEQFKALAKEFQQLESGVMGINGETGGKIIIVAAIAALLGDNPRQSTFASHRGPRARQNCRFCYHLAVHDPRMITANRTRLETLSTISRITARGSLAALAATANSEFREVSLFAGENPMLHLRWTDPHADTPLELLHTVLLGVARYCVQHFFEQLPKSRKQFIAVYASPILAGIDDIDTSDCDSRMSPADFLLKRVNMVGRDYRVLMQYGCYQMRDFLVVGGLEKVTRHATRRRDRQRQQTLVVRDPDLPSDYELPVRRIRDPVATAENPSDSNSPTPSSHDSENSLPPVPPQVTTAVFPTPQLTGLGTAWLRCAQLTKLLYTTAIPDLEDYLGKLECVIMQVIHAFVVLDESRAKKRTKLHLLMHAPELIRRYGPLRLYMTEAQERQNGSIRNAIQRTTKHATSKDVMIRYLLEKNVVAACRGLHVIVDGQQKTLLGFPPAPIKKVVVPPPLGSKLQEWRGVRANRSHLFLLSTLGPPFDISAFCDLVPIQGDCMVSLHNSVLATNKNTTAKTGVSFVEYTGRNTAVTRLGKLILVLSFHNGAHPDVCVVQRFAMTPELDVFENPILEPSGHVDYVYATTVLRAVSCVHHCTENCKTVVGRNMDRDRLKHLSVRQARRVHDPLERRVVWNRHRWEV